MNLQNRRKPNRKIADMIIIMITQKRSLQILREPDIK